MAVSGLRIDSRVMPVVMTYDDAAIRYQLRRARTDVQVGTPAKGHRTRTFWAALQQFEELLDAAGAVGPASRPLPLFYALSQAGRAITAAHGSVPWELHGHGLDMPGPSTPKHLLERRIEPKPTGNDSFHRVADTTNSGVLTAPVELGAVWASLPYELPKAWADKWPSTLKLDIRKALLGPSAVVTNEAHAYVLGMTDRQIGNIRESLEQYPTAQGWYGPGGGPPHVEDDIVGWIWGSIWCGGPMDPL
jgi:hypothetical protein